MAKRPGETNRAKFKRIAALTFKITAAGILLLLAAGTVYFILLINQTSWKDFDPAKLENLAQSLLFYDKDGKPVGGLYGSENRVKISLSEIPDFVKNGLIATEDVRFYSHPGVDLRRIAGALWADIRKGSKAQGASTISQQLIKNTHLTNEKTWARKLQEARLALQLEQVYTKDQILEMYLNTVYWGNGAYGIETAADAYFSKHAKELTLSEGALLIGILKGPGYYDPRTHMDRAVGRRDLVLSLMNKYGYLSEQDMNAAKKEKVTLKLAPKLNTDFGFYLDETEKDAEAIIGISREDLISQGYRIYTTLDTALQAKCDSLFANKDLFPPNAADGTPVQGALVVMDSRTGGVRAIVGGRSYTTKLGLNRASSSRRQPGSAIKPVLVYGPALDRFGYNPATMIEDAPVDIAGYKPENAGGSYSGWVTLRQAVVRSINVPAVRVLNNIGLESAKDFAKNTGITFDPGDTSLALALGGFTSGVTPLELAAAYTGFANAGRCSKASFITKIVDSDDNVIYQNPYATTPVMSDATAFIMTDILHNAATSGTAKLLNFTKIPLAAKTGTVAWDSGTKDAWLASYNPDYVVVCWMGFDKTDKEHNMSSKVTGGNQPAQVCKEVYTYLYQNTAAPNFEMPSSVTLLALDAWALQNTGQILLAAPMTPEDQKLYEYFPVSQAPSQVSEMWQTPLTPTGFTVTLNERGNPLLSFTAVQNFARYDVYRVDAYNQSVKVKELQGSAGSAVSYEDIAVRPGTYYYYVSPVHPYLNVSGSPTPMIPVTVTGLASAMPGNTGGWFDWLFPSATNTVSPGATAAQ